MRPAAPKDQRTASAYIFGAICPARGTGAGLVMPRYTTEAMALHLEVIAQAVAPGAHAVLLLDQTGWHTTKKLAAPANITLLPLPARSPELKPRGEPLTVHARQLAPQSRFTSYADILDHCCAAWNTLIDRPKSLL